MESTHCRAGRHLHCPGPYKSEQCDCDCHPASPWPVETPPADGVRTVIDALLEANSALRRRELDRLRDHVRALELRARNVWRSPRAVASRA